MRLLIDGYNLLHATDLFGSGELAGTLQGSREALLSFLASRLSERERKRATIVFDAADAPPGLPDRAEVDGIRVRYARGYPDADSLLEELIEACRAPRELTVVSGDRRVQRAARQRGAAYVDSSAWHADLLRRQSATAPQNREKSIDAVEIDTEMIDAEHWTEEFSDEALLDEFAKQEQRLKNPEQPQNPGRGKKLPAAEPPDDFGKGIFDPFPPGYADDLASQIDPPDEEEPDE